MDMKNLMTRLRPEMVEVFNKRKELYPHTAKCLEKELETNYVVSDIKYSSFVELESIAYEAKVDYNNGWDFFNNII
jgi:hypothetical protein